MVALTTLKAFFQIGYLWKPENQRVRELHLVPFDEFSGTSWFAPLFEYAGNTAFFIPLWGPGIYPMPFHKSVDGLGICA